MRRSLLLVLMILVLTSILVTTFVEKSKLLTGSVISEPQTPLNCSNSEIKKIWDSIFIDNSVGVTILSSNTTVNGQCEKYFSYKTGSISYILSGKTTPSNETRIYAYSGNLSQGFKDVLNSFQDINSVNLVDNNGELIKDQNFFIIGTINRTSPILIANANSSFNSIFEINTGIWNENSLYNTKYFEFTKDYSVSGYNSTVKGNINSNYTFAEIFYIKTQTSNSNCVTNWIAQNTSCNPNETYKIYYIPNNFCINQTNMPENQTIDCDYNNNKIIGNSSNIYSLNINPSIKINNSDINNSLTYSGNQIVDILDGNNKMVSLSWDFSTPLNLRTIYIEKQYTQDDFGYIIINGLNVTKTVYVNRILNESNNLCIKDAEIQSILNISVGCNETQEYLLNCPGTNNSFSCTLTNSSFVVSGLTHSGIIEVGENNGSQCNSNWNCTSWNVCNQGTQTRICADTNNCGLDTTKPTESQTCIQECAPNWSCTDWNPSECPENQTQIRTCTDLNSCGLDNEKPNVEQTCSYNGSNTTKIFLVALIILVFVILIIVGLILYFMSKRNQIPLT